MNAQHGPLEEIASDWFVNRHDELDLFWDWATNIPHRVKGSYALIGLRRTGKTAILHRLFNRLFNEQDRVLPVYISFARYLKRTEPINSFQFAQEYFTGYVRSYLAFRYRKPEMFDDNVDYDKLYQIAHDTADEFILDLFKRYQAASVVPIVPAHNVMQWVINFPKGVARQRNMPTAMIVDEFQVLTRVLDPNDGRVRAVTDSFQSASETHWAPLLVSGSSVSMMVDHALGGMLSGRFRPKHLRALNQEYAYEMIFQLGQRNGITINEELALAIWELTRGYPYPIECLLNSSSPALQRLPSLDALPEVLLHELSHEEGALADHYRQEYGKYIHQLNGDQVIRKVLLWIIKYPDRRIFADEIAAELQLEERKVQETLDNLSAADIITSTGWYSYAGPADPMLRRYIEYSHAREVEKLGSEEAAQSLLTAYRELQGRVNKQVGHLAEIIVGGVMHSFDGRSVDGATYFNHPGLVTLPKFMSLERRSGVIKDGIPKEIDLIAEWLIPQTPTNPAQTGVWLVSVRHRDRAMGDQQVQEFLEQTTSWLAETQTRKPFDHITRWYISKLGFTKTALQLLQANGIYSSDLAQFNQLAHGFGFLPLSA